MTPMINVGHIAVQVSEELTEASAARWRRIDAAAAATRPAPSSQRTFLLVSVDFMPAKCPTAVV